MTISALTAFISLFTFICVIAALFLLFFRGKAASERGKHPLEVRRNYGLLLDACGGDRAKVKRLIDLEIEAGANGFGPAVSAALQHFLAAGDTEVDFGGHS